MPVAATGLEADVEGFGNLGVDPLQKFPPVAFDLQGLESGAVGVKNLQRRPVLMLVQSNAVHASLLSGFGERLSSSNLARSYPVQPTARLAS
jgi:hypothetical protein